MYLDREYVTLPAANYHTSLSVCSSQVNNVVYYVIDPSLGFRRVIYLSTLLTARRHVKTCVTVLNEWLSCNLCGKIHVSRFKAIHNCCTFVQPRHSHVIKLSLNRFYRSVSYLNVGSVGRPTPTMSHALQ